MTRKICEQVGFPAGEIVLGGEIDQMTDGEGIVPLPALRRSGGVSVVMPIDTLGKLL